MEVTFLCILASIGGIFLKVHDSPFTSFCYKERKFCDPSVIMCTFLEEQ